MLISTRVHGAIDYGVSAALAALAALPALPRPARRVLAMASVSHSSYAVLTDYEGGLVPVITMRQHLALDALAGSAIAVSGMAMRRQPLATRALLVGIGVLELGVVALSRSTPLSGPGQKTGPVARMRGTDIAAGFGYAPLDTPKSIADGVWVVDSVMRMGPGMMLPIRMTILRMADGGLLLHSPTGFSRALKATVEALGPVRHIVAPNLAHWSFLQDWQRAFPAAMTWAPPGVRQRRAIHKRGLRFDGELGDVAPPEWGGGITPRTITGGFGFAESALFHPRSGTLVLTDLAMNLEANRLPVLSRALVRLFQMDRGLPPPWLRLIMKSGGLATRNAVRELVALQPNQVIFAHGAWRHRDAKAALGWML